MTPLFAALIASCSLDTSGIQDSASDTSSAATGAGGAFGVGVTVAASTTSSSASTTSSSASSTASSGGATTSTSAAGGGGEPPCPAGSIGEIHDSFDGNTTDSTTWAAYADGKGHTSSGQMGGAVNVTSDGTRNLWAGYAQKGMDRPISSCQVFIEVPEVADSAPEFVTYFQVLHDDSNLYSISYHAKKLHFGVNASNMPATGLDVDYDPVKHRWWRIREQQGTTYFETSPDGKGWEGWFKAMTPMFAAQVHMNFGIGTSADAKSPGAARFDNLNVPPP